MLAHAFLPRIPPWLLVPLLLLMPVRLAAATDACEGCPPPTDKQLRDAVGTALETRNGREDTIYKDKGDCIASMQGAPEIKPIKFWLRRRASGEVWNCPHSKSSDTITVEAHHADKTEWTLQTTVGMKFKSLVAEVQASLTQGQTTGTTIVEVTRVSKTITPNWCRRIEWVGYFLAGEFKATSRFSLKQKWVWWTKNATTGYKVHAKGTVTVSCGSTEIEFRRKAPLAGYFDLTERTCEDSTCGDGIPRRLGFFPQLPPEIEPPPPVTPGSEPEPGGDEPGEPPSDESPSDGSSDIPSVTEPTESGDLGEPPGGPVPDPFEEPYVNPRDEPDPEWDS